MRQRQAIVVERPPGPVYRFLADPANLPTWVDPVSEVEIDDAPEHASTRFRHRVDADGAQASFQGEVDPVDPERTVRYRFQAEGPAVTTTFRLEPAGQGTEVTQELVIPLTRWATRLLAPFLWWSNRGRLKRQLAALKAALETQDRG